jgi:electron transfer flavoprotein beta subunit
LKIIVCIKQVPDSEAKVIASDGKISWGEAKLVINPFDEYAVEAALQQKEASGAGSSPVTVTVISIGAESEKDAIKHALAMGADNAILVADPALANLDSQGAARVLAAAIRKIGDGELAIFGRQTIDSAGGITAAQTARALGWPLLSLVGKIEIANNAIKVERTIEEGKQTAGAKLPAVLSVIQGIGEPRYPSFMGIRKASKAEIPIWSLADLGIAAPAAVVTRTELLNPPSRDIACELISGDSPEAIADALADKILAEKVL